jgi:hypothetical protein
MPRAIAVATLLCLAPLAIAADGPMKERPISATAPVFALYTQDFGIGPAGRQREGLIFVAWDDGQVVWSENRTQGGAPYRTGQIEPARVRDALKAIESDGFFNHDSLRRPYFGPDARSTVIVANTKEHRLKMQSWHELYETNGRVVATDKGLVPLEGRARFDVLLGEPAEYLFYRLMWNELRLRAAVLVPPESTPVNGNLVFRLGETYWVEPPQAP